MSGKPLDLFYGGDLPVEECVICILTHKVSQDAGETSTLWWPGVR